MKTKRKPTTGWGLVMGFMLTAPMLAILYLGQAWLGTPFVPFDLFDWLARVLPGGVIAFGIDLIKSIIAALNLEDISTSAKTAEHIMAILMVVAGGGAVGALLFNRWRNHPRGEKAPSGRLVGAVIGVFAAIITAGVNQTASAFPLFSLLWIVLVAFVWGFAYEKVYDRWQELLWDDTSTAEVQILDRRNFLIRFGGATAAVTVVGAGLGALTGGAGGGQDELAGKITWSDTHPLPNASDAVSPAPGTRAEFTPVRNHYRIDINSLPPVLHEEDWTLSVYGLVENPLELTLDDLRTKYQALDQFVTLSCISNPLGGDLIGTQRWTGVPLKEILKQARPKAEAFNLKIVSGDGFDEALSISKVMTDERVMLAYAWDGLPLTTAHGFPLRVYIPDLYGMKQPKWIVSIEVTDRYEEGYWVRRGWDEVAQVNATSVIDTIAGDRLVKKGDQTLVPIGGIAYAGQRGISKVEVRVDDGDWHEAQLRTPLSETTWVIWRYDWPFAAGDHLIHVRCTDGNGARQIEAVQGERPSGATGIIRKHVYL